MGRWIVANAPRGRIRGVSPELQERARELRKAMTPAERALWARLRNRQIQGLKFRRQHPLGRFVVDFCCPAERLVVEVDGEVHEDQEDEDEARTAVLESYGYRVLRFPNQAVIQDIEGVLKAIARAIR